ncbi:MAG: hypothetical protein QG639_120 [Patescibacteria group bacterium]|nr:hypothetical protein [Patescibacteria group bacterium]
MHVIQAVCYNRPIVYLTMPKEQIIVEVGSPQCDPNNTADCVDEPTVDVNLTGMKSEDLPPSSGDLCGSILFVPASILGSFVYGIRKLAERKRQIALEGKVTYSQSETADPEKFSQ